MLLTVLVNFRATSRPEWQLPMTTDQGTKTWLE